MEVKHGYFATATTAEYNQTNTDHDDKCANILGWLTKAVKQGGKYEYACMIFGGLKCVIEYARILCNALGLAKIFGGKSAKPHGGNWVKT